MLIEAIGLRLSGAAAKAFIGLGLVLAIAFCAWRAVAAFESAIDAADRRGEQRERLLWKSEIAASNAKVAEAQLQAERAARAASDRAATEIAALRQSLVELERANAALPNADSCGLDRDRVRLLRQQSGGARDSER